MPYYITTANATNTTTATTTSPTVWTSWISSTTATTTSIWTTWVDNIEEFTVPTTGVWRSQEDAERLQREAERLQRLHRAAAADARADELLISLLNAEQREQYKTEKYFTVCARSGKLYRLRRAILGSIDVLDDAGKVKHRYCAHLRNDVPVPDHLIAQKFMIEHHEQEFLRIANRS